MCCTRSNLLCLLRGFFFSLLLFTSPTSVWATDAKELTLGGDVTITEEGMECFVNECINDFIECIGEEAIGPLTRIQEMYEICIDACHTIVGSHTRIMKCRARCHNDRSVLIVDESGVDLSCFEDLNECAQECLT